MSEVKQSPAVDDASHRTGVKNPRDFEYSSAKQFTAKIDDAAVQKHAEDNRRRKSDAKVTGSSWNADSARCCNGEVRHQSRVTSTASQPHIDNSDSDQHLSRHVASQDAVPSPPHAASWLVPPQPPVESVPASADLDDGGMSGSWKPPSVSRQTSAFGDVDADRMMRKESRGRGLLKFHQLQSAKMASQRAQGVGNGAEVSAGACSPLSVTSPETVGDFDAGTVSESSSNVLQSSLPSDPHSTPDVHMPNNVVAGSSLPEHGPHQSSGSWFSPSSAPATYGLPLASYHPHMLPYSWAPTPAPVCGLIPPGFASPAVIPQTVPLPYQQLPLYPAYGYHMMHVIPPSSHSADGQNIMDKVD